MNLQEKINNISKTSNLSQLVNGTAYDIDQLWHNCIEPNLPCEEAVTGWHSILMKYIHDNPIFSLRIYGSYADKNNDATSLRRGFLNLTNYNFKTVYVDNFFTSYFFSMAYDNFVPLYDEFKKMIDYHKFPAGYMSTKEENKYRSFLKGKDPLIQAKGYKIAHIHDAGQYFNFDKDINTIGKFCKLYFPRGKYDDWKSYKTDEIGTYHYRNVYIEKTDEQRVYNFLVAHFLRTVHPINYFLVPKRGHISFYDNGISKDEIGEYDPLIKYVENKISQKYKNIYNEYLTLIAPINNAQSDQANRIINAEYWFDKKIASTAKRNKIQIKVTTLEKSEDYTSSKLKIGKMVKTYLIPALQNNQITSDEIQKLQGADYSKQIFDINYPLLSKERFINNRPRYYANSLLINGETYYVCQEWFDKSRQKLVSWLIDHGVVIEDGI